MVSGTLFTLDASYGYCDFKMVGKGSYGVVASATCGKLKKKVAIKKITPVAKHVYDAKHVLREIRLMRYMGQHVNIITLEDLYLRDHADELYIVMELMDSDLHQVIQSKQVLSEAHIKHFLHQLCCGIKYLHDHRIIHRDLKPGNLLVSRDCQLRITDFGLARERPTGDDRENPDVDIDEPMTVHVVTRWYRAPELMLLPDGLYSYAVDIWSIGCILAELLGRQPLFPGKSFIHQLSLIFDVLGAPARGDVVHITSPEARQFLAQQAGKEGKPWSFFFPTASPEALEMLDKLLVFNPDKRCTVSEALALPFLQRCGLEDSKIFPPVDERCNFAFEEDTSTRYQLKQMIVSEVTTFRRERSTAGGLPPFPVTAAAKPPASQARMMSKASPDKASQAVREEEKGAPAAPAKAIPRYLQSTSSQAFRRQLSDLPLKRSSSTNRRSAVPSAVKGGTGVLTAAGGRGGGGGGVVEGGDRVEAEAKGNSKHNSPQRKGDHDGDDRPEYGDDAPMVSPKRQLPQEEEEEEEEERPFESNPEHKTKTDFMMESLIQRIRAMDSYHDLVDQPAASPRKRSHLADPFPPSSPPHSSATRYEEEDERTDRAKEAKGEDSSEEEDLLPRSPLRSPHRQSNYMNQISGMTSGSPDRRSLIVTYTSPHRLGVNGAPSTDRTPLRRSGGHYMSVLDDPAASLPPTPPQAFRSDKKRLSPQKAPQSPLSSTSIPEEVLAEHEQISKGEDCSVDDLIEESGTKHRRSLINGRSSASASGSANGGAGGSGRGGQLHTMQALKGGETNHLPPDQPELMPEEESRRPAGAELKKKPSDKKLTVPHSPKFSLMSWQRKQPHLRPPPPLPVPPAGKTGTGERDQNKRNSQSAPRMRPTIYR